MGKAMEFIGMDKPVSRKELEEAKVGQWIKVCFTDNDPEWAILTDILWEGDTWVHVLYLREGGGGGTETEDIDQIAEIGPMVSYPDTYATA